MGHGGMEQGRNLTTLPPYPGIDRAPGHGVLTEDYVDQRSLPCPYNGLALRGDGRIG